MYDTYRTACTRGPLARHFPEAEAKPIPATEDDYAKRWEDECRALRAAEEIRSDPHKTTQNQILSLMGDGRERTVDDVSRKIGRGREQTRRLLTLMAREGALSVDEVHLEGLARAKLYRLSESNSGEVNRIRNEALGRDE